MAVRCHIINDFSNMCSVRDGHNLQVSYGAFSIETLYYVKSIQENQPGIAAHKWATQTVEDQSLFMFRVLRLPCVGIVGFKLKEVALKSILIFHLHTKNNSMLKNIPCTETQELFCNPPK